MTFDYLYKGLLSQFQRRIDMPVKIEDLLIPHSQFLLLQLLLNKFLTDPHEDVEEDSATDDETDSEEPILPSHSDNYHSRHLKTKQSRNYKKNLVDRYLVPFLVSVCFCNLKCNFFSKCSI